MRWMKLAAMACTTTCMLVACSKQDNATKASADNGAPIARTSVVAAAMPVPIQTDAASKARAALDPRTRGEYAQAYNRLNDDSRSVASMFDGYLGLHLDTRHPDPKSFGQDPHTLDAVLQDLKGARASGSSIGVLDLSVDSVIANGDMLVARWKPLHPYYQSKGFVLDDYAQGRAADSGMRTAFKDL